MKPKYRYNAYRKEAETLEAKTVLQDATGADMSSS